MKSTLFALASRNRPSRLCFAVFSQKRSDWEAFEPAAGCIGLVSDPVEVEEAVAWAAGDLLQGRAKTGEKSPAVVFVFDDLVALLQKSPSIAGGLGELATLGRGLRLFLMLGTQQAGSRSGMASTLVDDAVACRVVYRASSATAGARATGSGGLGVETLTGRKGDALFVADDQVARIATGFADDRLILQLPAGDWSKPWAIRSKGRSTERSNLALEAPRTGWNGSERVVLPLVDPHEGDHVAAVEGGEEERVVEELATPSTLADRIVAGEKLNGNRPPTAVEAAALRDLFARLGSKEKVYRAAWGFKNGKVAGWLNEVLSEAIVEPVLSPEDQVAAADDALNRLDLASAEGRRVFDQLRRAGLVELPPDTSNLVYKGE